MQEKAFINFIYLNVVTELNKNNFLRWKGSFDAAPFTAHAVDDAVSAAFNLVSVDILVLANDVSTYGIDFSSIIITVQDNIDRDATWNSTTKKITYYLRAADYGNVRTIKYKWTDINGNESNEASVVITIAARATAWRGLAASYGCELDGGGDKTGNGLYDTLEQYFTDDNTAEGTTKANDPDDPDYIAPVEDLAHCDPDPSTRIAIGYFTSFHPPITPAMGYVYFPKGEVPTGGFVSIGNHMYIDAGLLSEAPDGYYNDAGAGLLYTVDSGTVVNIQLSPL